jgi:precorrin isomerase
MSDEKTQAIERLTLAKADIVIAQLIHLENQMSAPQIQSVRKALRDAAELVQELRDIASGKVKVKDDTEPLIYYYTDGNSPSAGIEEQTSKMRLGRPREIRRYVLIDPVWAIRVNDEKNWHDRFRIVDTYQNAMAMKVLFNV